MLWNNAQTAQQKIRELEGGIEVDFIETISDPYKVQRLAFDLVRQAREEILVIFSTVNAFQRQVRSGTVESLKEAVYLRGVKVRILTPFNEKINQLVAEWKPIVSSDGSKHDGGADKTVHQPFNIDNLKIRSIEPQLQTKVSILIVDRRYSLSVELKDDTRETSYKAMGLTSYSNSKSTVLSYVSTLESLWNITIKDDGEGIDSEIMPRLFTKFATKSEHGIGLGLYISKSIIEAHGGRIWAENNANGKGATFSFSLPMTN